LIISNRLRSNGVYYGTLYQNALTLRQRILKWVYPLFVRYKKIRGEDIKLETNKKVTPSVPFHELAVILNNGTLLSFENLKGKKVLIVNTASNCGYTNQYADLQELHERHKEKLIILAFPSNEFKEQEKGTDEEIAQFCQLNFGVSFPIARKSVVSKTSGQNIVFQWLTRKEQNGWNEQSPTWNFSKYLIDEEGMLINYFAPAVSPLDPVVVNAINS
jgi:glutathione peroxidase